jgi:hypothetical protein
MHTGSTRAMLAAVKGAVPVERLAVHFHDTYGQALANILVGALGTDGWMDGGVFDSFTMLDDGSPPDIMCIHKHTLAFTLQRCRRAWPWSTPPWPGWAAAPTPKVSVLRADWAMLHLPAALSNQSTD